MRDKEEEFDELEHLQNLLLLIRSRLREHSAHRLFVPSYEVSLVAQMIDREVEQWLDDAINPPGGTSGIGTQASS